MNRYVRAILEVAGFVPSERVVDAFRKGQAKAERMDAATPRRDEDE